MIRYHCDGLPLIKYKFVCILGAEGNSKVGLLEKNRARNSGEMGKGESV